MFWDYLLLSSVSLLAIIGLFPKKENTKWKKWTFVALTVIIIASNYILLSGRKQKELENQETQDLIYANTYKSAQSFQEAINYLGSSGIPMDSYPKHRDKKG